MVHRIHQVAPVCLCVQSTAAYRQYCYDVDVTRPLSLIPHLLTGPLCSQRLCCTVATNGSASASFLPRVILPEPAYADNRQVDSTFCT